MNTTSGPGQHHGEVALYVAHITREEKKQQIKMLMTDLLFLLPSLSLLVEELGPPFFNF